MLREGLGLIPPRPVEIAITAADIAILRQEAERRQVARAYASRRDSWGRGLINDPILQGLVGEFGLVCFLNEQFGAKLSVDMEDRPRGDGDCDITFYPLSLQVKTRKRRGHLLIRRKTDGDSIVPIRWDACICATWNPDEEENNRVVCLDGWIGKKQVLAEAEFKPARVGDHMNLELPDRKLQSMDYLVEYIVALRGYRGLK